MASYLDDCMRVCPICNKKFCVSFVPNWAYKIKLTNTKKKRYTLFCSWKCLNVGKEKANSKRKYKEQYSL